MGKIASISYSKHNIFNDSEILITTEKTFSTDNYITLLIGENGSGKSELLKSVVQYYRREHSDSSVWSSMNIVSSGATKNSTWPKKIIAYSLSINDKFPYQKNKWDGVENYFYAGLKTTSNSIYIGKYREDLLKCFYLTSKEEDKEELLLKCLQLMGLPTRFQFRLTIGRSFKFFLSKREDNLSLKNYIQDFITNNSSKKDKDLEISSLIENPQALDLVSDFVVSFYKGSHNHIDLNVNVVEKK